MTDSRLDIVCLTTIFIRDKSIFVNSKVNSILAIMTASDFK